MEEQSTKINWQELNNFLAEFRAADLPSNPEDMGRILKTCAYCGKPSDEAPITADRFGEDLCPSCKSELVWQWDHCQRLADETTHNVEQLFSISWKKHIKIEKLIGEIPTDMGCEDQFVLGKFLGRIAAVWENWRDKKRNSGIFRNIAFVKTKRNVCNVKIRADTPAGMVAAELVYLVLFDYMNTSSLDRQTRAGIASWCMVHYLSIMDYMRYAVFYDKALANVSGAGSGGTSPQNMVASSSALEGAGKYMELHGIANPCTAPITPLQWIIAQFVPEAG